MLLLFAVRMVRTGIERSFGSSFQKVLTENRGVISASLGGMILAMVLQSSAAVALLASGFFAQGYMSFAIGLAVVLGGDLGSALVIQILSFQLDWLVPVLLAIGGWLFVKTDRERLRQIGRILMGVAFILISLRFLREAVDPIRDSAFLPAIADYLTKDFVTAFIVGVTLAFVMHSSVAAILMFVTLAQIGAIPLEVALSLTLGANMGSGLIPVWLTRGMTPEGRRLPLANLMLRGGLSTIALAVSNVVLEPNNLMFASPMQSVINVHIAFNLTLLIVALPFCKMLAKPLAYLLPAEPNAADDAESELQTSALDYDVMDKPALAIANLKRELLRMSELVECMHNPVLAIYENGNKSTISRVRKQDKTVNNALSAIRDYVAKLPQKKYSKAERKAVRGLMEYSIRLETAGDIIAKRLTNLAEDKRDAGVQFSQEGWSELSNIDKAITANFKLAANVLISDDLESARQLVNEQTEMKRAEHISRKRHLKRLQQGHEESLETSDIHLETLRAFRDLNSCILAIAYPILYRNGQLLETRLIQNLAEADV